MHNISQVAQLTGISTRTLQYYDEIRLLKPRQLAESGYRMYDDANLKTFVKISSKQNTVLRHLTIFQKRYVII